MLLYLQRILPLNFNSKYIVCISVLSEDAYKKWPKHVVVVSNM
jgi:hypothetical protein